LGDSDSAVSPRDRWYCGPPTDRRAYVVDDIRAMRGGEGHVLRAERRSFPGDPVRYAGPVSLKICAEAVDAERVQRLRERWHRLAGIDHPNLARVLEVFQGPGLFRAEPPPGGDEDVLYATASWVEGRGLRGVAPVDPEGAFALAADLAAGIDTLHDHGVLHRDIHPGNVVIDGDGRAVLIDFCSSRPDDGSETRTVAGAVGFIAPETANGTSTAATDRWGLGMVTVFALLGHPQGTMTDDALQAELAAALAGIAGRREALRLLRAMIAPTPARRPLDGPRWARDLQACLTHRQRRSRPRLVAAAVAAVGLVAVGAAGFAAFSADPPDDGRDAAAPRPTAATAPPCEPVRAGERGASPDLAAAVARVAPGTCAGGVAETFGEAQVQPLTDARGRPDGVVLVSPSGAAVRLTPTMWASYREIAGRANPENAAAYGGYPVTVTRAGDPADPVAVIIWLDQGGMIVGRREDTQMFWLPQQVLQLWAAHGGASGDLGVPTSNPHFVGGRLQLDFEHGYMTADSADFGSLLLGAPAENAVVVPDPAEPLRGAAVAGHIVRQATGTAWFVDDGGRRHWIPSGETWDCLGGADAVAADNLPGWAVATLPLAEAARCP
jgi:Protein kinase domain